MKAVIVVGSHHAGKSKTINKYLKAFLGIAPKQHKFDLKGKPGAAYSQSKEEAAWQHGIVLSQSSEEAGRTRYLLQFVRKYKKYAFLVLAARPSNEKVSCLRELKRLLRSHGYRVSTVRVHSGKPESFYRARARRVAAMLRA